MMIRVACAWLGLLLAMPRALATPYADRLSKLVQDASRVTHTKDVIQIEESLGNQFTKVTVYERASLRKKLEGMRFQGNGVGRTKRFLGNGRVVQTDIHNGFKFNIVELRSLVLAHYGRDIYFAHESSRARPATVHISGGAYPFYAVVMPFRQGFDLIVKVDGGTGAIVSEFVAQQGCGVTEYQPVPRADFEKKAGAIDMRAAVDYGPTRANSNLPRNP